MGVIRRQSLKHSAVNIVGLVIGAMSTLFVYPHVLEASGLIQVLMYVGIIGLPALSMGGNMVAIRFFPRFKDKASGHNGFLVLLLLLCMAGYLTVALLALVFHQPLWEFIHSGANGRSPLLARYFWMAAPLAFFYTVGVVLSIYAFNFKRIVVPTLLIDFSMKLALPALLICVWQGWLPLEAALWGLIIHSFLVMTGMALYLRSLGEWHLRPNWAFFTPALRRELFRFIGFGAFGGFALQMASRIDIFMVGTVGALEWAGVYAISSYIGSAVDIPTKSLYAASASSVAQYLNEENHAEMEILYKKVSINLLVAGLLLFGSIWISVDSLFEIVANGKAVSAGKYVLLFIGLSRIVEMGTGLNNNMVYYSSYYLWSLVSLGVLAVGNVLFNLWLIPLVGMNGAAISTLLSVTCYNAVSLGLVWLKFRLQPFSKNTIRVLLLAISVYAVVQFIPLTNIGLLDIAIRSGLYFCTLGILILRFRISPDLNDGFDVLRAKLFLRKNKD